MDLDCNILFTNCWIQSNNTSAIYKFFGGSTGSGRKFGGFTIKNCTLAFSAAGFTDQTTAGTELSTTYPTRITNCNICQCGNTVFQFAALANATIVTNCRFVSGISGNITDGGGNVTAGINGIDNLARLIQGLSKRHPWMPQIAGILDGDGTATGAPATDLFGYTRPGTPSVGALEINDLTAGGGLLVHPGMTGGIRG